MSSITTSATGSLTKTLIVIVFLPKVTVCLYKPAVVVLFTLKVFDCNAVTNNEVEDAAVAPTGTSVVTV